MKSKLGILVAGLTLLIGAAAFGPVASAGCADAVKARKASVVMNPLWQGQSDKEKEESEPIVGLWRMNLIAEGDSAFGFKDGDIFDSGIAQWHGDGTELLNSSRVPDTGSFCMGIWKKTSHFHYSLNHFAKSWQAIFMDRRKFGRSCGRRRRQQLERYLERRSVRYIWYSAGAPDWQNRSEAFNGGFDD
jgi:hypothetical protein